MAATPDPISESSRPDPVAAATEAHIALRRLVALHDIACPTCGFNLRGCDDERCPECGAAYGAYLTLGAPIPTSPRRLLAGRAIRELILLTLIVAHLPVGLIGVIAAVWAISSYGSYGAGSVVALHLCAAGAAIGALLVERNATRRALRLGPEAARILVLVAIVPLVIVSLAPSLAAALVQLL